ncbi:MAG: septum formation initiator family protein [bacterium]
MVAGKGLQNQTPHRELSPHALRRLAGNVVVIILMVLVGLFLVWRPIQAARIVRDIERLNGLKAELIEINARLKLERATLTRLDRVEELARREYGFIDPNKSQIFDVFIKDSTS